MGRGERTRKKEGGHRVRMSKKRRRDDGGRRRIMVDYYYVNIEVAFILPPYARREKLTYNSGSESRNHRDGHSRNYHGTLNRRPLAYTKNT